MTQLCKVLSVSVDQLRRSCTYKTYGQKDRRTQGDFSSQKNCLLQKNCWRGV